jgi:uncharacterized phage protein gp47/JayE
MAYSKPYVDSSGLHVPTYDDILQDIITNVKSLYGSDIYLENDSADYQLLSIFALKVHDAMQAMQLAYNSRSPVTAVGAAFDAIVKLNGIRRKTPSYSTCQVILTGVAGTVVSNGVVQDLSGYKWDLPATVNIGPGGTVTVTATCETIGAINAAISDISQIVTPTSGWTSVTNAVEAVAGQPVETDTELRARQAISTELPSHSMFAGTVAAVANVSGVTRYKGYENNTNTEDDDGVPGHSIAMVVEGGEDEDVAFAIYANKSAGCGTYGTTTISVEDPYYELTIDINFFRPTYVDIFLTLTITPLTGYTSAIADDIKAALADYLDTLEIGEDLTLSALYAVAMGVTDIKAPAFSITALTAGQQGLSSISVTTGGTGYTTDTDVPVTGGSGSGATVDITASAGVITDAVINKPGSGYEAGDVLTVVQSVGADGTLTVSAVTSEGTSDIAIAFDETTRGNVDNITITDA